MNRDAFARRVADLREAWAERRQVRTLTAAHDYASQVRLLMLLYEWAAAEVADINEVYAGDVPAHVTPRPAGNEGDQGFSLLIAPGYSIAFELAPRQRGGATHWFVAVNLSAGLAGGVTPAGPHRRAGQWTRERLEDLVLSVLGAYERALAGNR